MAFNHSRLGALERFNLLSTEIINTPHLRNKIRNRSRMLFRAMIDSDFKDLVEVLKKYPVFFDLANDQMIHGRIWNETYAKPESASAFLELLHQHQGEIDESLFDGLKRRLQPIEELSHDEAKEYLEELLNRVQNLHILIKEHFAQEFTQWLEAKDLHPLQKILWQKKIENLRSL